VFVVITKLQIDAKRTTREEQDALVGDFRKTQNISFFFHSAIERDQQLKLSCHA